MNDRNNTEAQRVAPNDPDNEEIIDLTEVVDSAAGDVIEGDTAPDAPAGPTPPAPPEALPVDLTDKQVEAALERVIEKVYAGKIEQLMIQSIEKTIKREIEKIKNELLDDNDMLSA